MLARDTAFVVRASPETVAAADQFHAPVRQLRSSKRPRAALTRLTAGQLGLQQRARAHRTLQPQTTTQRGNPVRQPAQAAARADRRPTAAVVSDLDHESRTAALDRHLDLRCRSVLDDVRQRLRNHEIRRRLHRGGQAPHEA